MKQIKTEKINVVEPIRSKEDLQRIIEWLEENHSKKYSVLFQLGINSGLRISDLLSFDVGDVYHKTELTLREKKTGKYKKFPLQEDMQLILNDFCKNRDHNEALFVGKNDIRLDRTQVYRVICQACQELGINANVGTHTMRKTFGYHHYKQFKDIALLQGIFNHSSPDVTKRYIGITQDEINDSYMKLNLKPVEITLDDFKLTSRIKARRATSYIKNYIKNGGTRHLDFALDILELMGAA